MCFKFSPGNPCCEESSESSLSSNGLSSVSALSMSSGPDCAVWDTGSPPANGFMTVSEVGDSIGDPSYTPCCHALDTTITTPYNGRHTCSYSGSLTAGVGFPCDELEISVGASFKLLGDGVTYQVTLSFVINDASCPLCSVTGKLVFTQLVPFSTGQVFSGTIPYASMTITGAGTQCDISSGISLSFTT